MLFFRMNNRYLQPKLVFGRFFGNFFGRFFYFFVFYNNGVECNFIEFKIGENSSGVIPQIYLKNAVAYAESGVGL